MAGVVCLPFGNVVALGVRCVLGQPRAGAVRGVVRPVGGVWRYRGQRGWLAGWIGWAMDQNRHSGRSAAQTRNPCPVERDWIPAVAGMTIWLGVLCQRSGVGWRDWFGDGSKPSFRAKRSADPESMPDWKRLDSRRRGNDDLVGNDDQVGKALPAI